MKLKKTIALFLSMILLFSAAACGKETKTEKTSKAETVQQETQLQTSVAKPGGGSGGTSSGTVQVQQTTGQVEEGEEEDEEYEEEDEGYYGNTLSQEEIYNQLFDTLIFNTVSGYSGLQAAERKIDYDAYPEKYDLREYGVVTPVKSQLPFGTCWAFGAIAACETSILSEMNTTYEETPLDLSEHHLAWFVNMHLEDDTNQNGEGVWHLSEWNTLAGGFVYSPSVLLATGTGVALEKEFPYRGKKGLIDPETRAYSSLDDWSIDPKDRFKQAYELEETRILPSVLFESEHGEPPVINETALYDLKDELLAGRGVAVSYNAAEEAYNDETCAHFGREGDDDGHCCCIVGWDDTFSRDNFCFLNKDGKTEIPAGDGAWIVKNSWGAETESFPNDGDFGIKDEQGRSTGYFYLSYYDETAVTFVTFDFLVDQAEEDYYFVNQYDYLHSATAQSSYSEDMLVMANEFEAEADEVLRCISLESGAPGVHIHYEVCRVTDPGTGPDSAEIWTQGDLDCRYAGFHRIDLDKPLELKAGEHYLVSFYQEADVDGHDVYLVSFRSGENELGKGTESDYYVKGIVNPGESWIYFEGADQWVDWYDIVQYWHVIDEKTDYDNFSIKGYADPLK